ncbi:bifunctional DNA primase/polymerase [Pseudonocardia acaciae]|uniref:bifunctional DNA primase/polymerase n=1 Tax=Pseudonocardia acaciae TaxID=551276 RepID=UPI000B0A41B0|nr:bifunctional DNA primase/polymerase [Pseudonocardia acaciae]
MYGAELRAGALCLVDHGWPVVPGTWSRGEGWCGPESPAAANLPVPVRGAVSSSDPAVVAEWWAQAPFSVLLTTGEVLDVLEVPAWMGRRMTVMLRSVDVVVPLAATPTGRWWFPVTPGGSDLPDEVAGTDAILHGVGSWVLAPPSECADGLVHWRVHPASCGWRLPASNLVYGAAAEAVRWRASEGDDRSVAQRPAGVASGVRS